MRSSQKLAATNSPVAAVIIAVVISWEWEVGHWWSAPDAVSRERSFTALREDGRTWGNVR